MLFILAFLYTFYRKQYSDAKIFVAPSRKEIYWGHISLLEADLACHELLYSRHDEWKFYLNLAGSELPRYMLKRLLLIS